MKLFLARVVFWSGVLVLAGLVAFIGTAIVIQSYEVFRGYPDAIKAIVDLLKGIGFLILPLCCLIIWGLCGSYIDERKKK